MPYDILQLNAMPVPELLKVAEKLNIGGVRREHLVGRDVACARRVAGLHVRGAHDEAVVVQVADGRVDEGEVVGADAQRAVCAKVVGVAVALVELAAQAVARARVRCRRGEAKGVGARGEGQGMGKWGG